jgi:hypothetical protein
MAHSELREMRKLLKKIADVVDTYTRRVNVTEMLQISQDLDSGTLCK